mmetsp:Transcript_21419/g.44615  ORF Transcript_21419/g.44615 Transcript_21419/m.44615 type:complete len:264 (-) Transcript_21419:1484-2275(-)
MVPVATRAATAASRLQSSKIPLSSNRSSSKSVFIGEPSCKLSSLLCHALTLLISRPFPSSIAFWSSIIPASGTPIVFSSCFNSFFFFSFSSFILSTVFQVGRITGPPAFAELTVYTEKLFARPPALDFFISLTRKPALSKGGKSSFIMNFAVLYSRGTFLRKVAISSANPTLPPYLYRQSSTSFPAMTFSRADADGWFILETALKMTAAGRLMSTVAAPPLANLLQLSHVPQRPLGKGFFSPKYSIIMARLQCDASKENLLRL